jgi:hypothetical protein
LSSELFTNGFLRPQAAKDTPSATTPGKITDWVVPSDKSGEFKRQQSSFRSWISREPGAEFPPEKGRYHLYVSYACPWVSIFFPSPFFPGKGFRG